MYPVAGVGTYSDGSCCTFVSEDTTTVLGRVVTTVALSRRLPVLKAAPIPTPKQQHIDSIIVMIRIIMTTTSTMAAIIPPTIAPTIELTIIINDVTNSC